MAAGRQTTVDPAAPGVGEAPLQQCPVEVSVRVSVMLLTWEPAPPNLKLIPRISRS